MSWDCCCSAFVRAAVVDGSELKTEALVVADRGREWEAGGAGSGLCGSEERMEGGTALGKKAHDKVMVVVVDEKNDCEYADDLNEPFLCFICLELAHKPVVNACGHMFCFWCVHRAMNTDTESYCPLCRRPYMHFPRVCEQLHFLLLKAVPEAYRRRCKEVKLNESENRLCSPQFNDGLDYYVSGESIMDALPQSSPEGAPSVTKELALPKHGKDNQISTVDVQGDHILKGKLLDTISSSSSLQTVSDSTDALRESSDTVNGGMASSSPYVTVSDLLCISCRKLLYRPVVVNCGHVFCEGCITTVEDAAESALKCFTCGSIHPGGFPHVCLELHQYLEQNFSLEYEKRKNELAADSPELQKSRSNLSKDIQTSDVSKKVRKSTPQPHPRMHANIGCDGCGMFPMFGPRFKCIDCPELPGYDLCWHCHKNGTNLVGRFNQQHTVKHQIREVNGNSSPFDGDFQDQGEGSEGMETYFGIVAHFA